MYIDPCGGLLVSFESIPLCILVSMFWAMFYQEVWFSTHLYLSFSGSSNFEFDDLIRTDHLRNSESLNVHQTNIDKYIDRRSIWLKNRVVIS